MHDPLTPVFRLVREMEAYDEGDDLAQVCGLCGTSLVDLSRQIIGRDGDGNLVAITVCSACFINDTYESVERSMPLCDIKNVK